MKWYLMGELVTRFGKQLESVKFKIHPVGDVPGGDAIFDYTSPDLLDDGISAIMIVGSESTAIMPGERVGAYQEAQGMIDTDGTLKEAPAIKLSKFHIPGMIEARYRGDDGCVYTIEQGDALVTGNHAVIQD